MNKLQYWFILLVLTLTACGAPEQVPIVEKLTATHAPLPRTVAPGSPLPTIPPKTGQVPGNGRTANSTITSPQVGGTLLHDVWGKATVGISATSFLLYSEVVSPRADAVANVNSFWRVSLNDISQRQKVVDLIPALSPTSPIYGELSPDGLYIAYLIATSDHTADLHIMRSNGNDDRLIAQELAPTVSRTQHRFAWSQNSRYIAFIKYWEKGQEFYVYNVQTPNQPQRLAQVGGAGLAGWLDATHLLIEIAVDRKKPLQLTALDIQTGNQETVAEFPRSGLFATQTSPDWTSILMSEYNFNLANRQFTKISGLDGQQVWGPNNTTLLEFSHDSNVQTHVITIDHAVPSVKINLLPPSTISDTVSLLSASPDGMYVVVCIASSTSKSSPVQTLLYDARQHQWQTLVEGPVCAGVLGWLPSP